MTARDELFVRAVEAGDKDALHSMFAAMVERIADLEGQLATKGSEVADRLIQWSQVFALPPMAVRFLMAMCDAADGYVGHDDLLAIAGKAGVSKGRTELNLLRVQMVAIRRELDVFLGVPPGHLRSIYSRGYALSRAAVSAVLNRVEEGRDV